ncbi:2-hydroxyacid dehydrogenase [Flaviflagellibacter deserti]|uniref:2-hydroxyacid dehydrogenase n=1 Tax=Flaviflagellibacter deserti TaxID=2267266 RepID=A0ABV9Z4Q7_9HYPH
MRDTLIFYSQFDDFDAWRKALESGLPDLDIRRADEALDPASVRYALVWNPPAGFFARYPNLKLVINLGAGVDSLVGRDDLPDVPITRLSDPNMSRMMAGFVLFAVLRYARDIPVFERAQREHRWHYVHPREARDIRVSVLGLGELGGYAAGELVRQGFDVRGWSRSLKDIEGVSCFAGADALDQVLAETDILVVMLPATPETRGRIGARELSLLPKGAKLINVSRGDIVDQQALVAALQGGRIAEATLDVFQTEPLPADDVLWTLPNVLITPHLASIALPSSAAPQIAENIRRVRIGEKLDFCVDVKRGY